MVSDDEFGSFIAEFEGFRDSILDLIVELRTDIEKLRDEVDNLKDTATDTGVGQRRLT